MRVWKGAFRRANNRQRELRDNPRKFSRDPRQPSVSITPLWMHESFPLPEWTWDSTWDATEPRSYCRDFGPIIYRN